MQRLWDNGRLLAMRLENDDVFPLRIPLKHPGARELGECFDEARDWIQQLRYASSHHGYTLEWKTFRHRQLGENSLPVAALIDSPEQALKLLHKQQAARRFDNLSQKILATFPELRDWLARKPLTTLKLDADWPRLLAILRWLREHPRPNCYLRQIDLPGVHTKFIERHRGLLSELLDRILPPEAIVHEAKGVRQFERRYGFLSKPALIRFRLLDPGQSLAGLRDLSIPAADFADLDPPVQRVFITENDINGLAFPPLPESLVIFGLGYGLEVLKEARWLAGCKLYYWGDIDTHGFAMLDQLRHHHPQARSFLMDDATLRHHHALWGEEERPTNRDLTWLGTGEQKVYDSLRYNLLGERVRLEQERIGFAYLQRELAAIETEATLHPGVW